MYLNKKAKKPTKQQQPQINKSAIFCSLHSALGISLVHDISSHSHAEVGHWVYFISEALGSTGYFYLELLLAPQLLHLPN